MSAPIPSTTFAFDLERLKRAIQHLPAEQRASLRWAPTALEAPLRRLLDVDRLSPSLCDEAAVEYTQVIFQILYVVATLIPDPQILSAFLSEARESVHSPLNLALLRFARSDVIAEALAIWMNDILQASTPYDVQIFGVLAPGLRRPPQTYPSAPPNLTTGLCLDALAFGIRERASALRLHDLMVQATASFSQWIDLGPSLDAHYVHIAETAADPADRQDAQRVLGVHRQRQVVVVPFQRALVALNEASALAEAGQRQRAAQRLAQEDLSSPSSAALAALHHRLTNDRALPFVSHRLFHPMPTFKQLRAALASAPPEHRWIAVHVDGSFESAPTLQELRNTLGERGAQMLFHDRGPFDVAELT